MAPFADRVGYKPPATPGDVILDVVTVTRNRPQAMMAQAERLARQMGPHDRWVVVKDAGSCPPDTHLAALVGLNRFFMLELSYRRGDGYGFVNRARHVGCSSCRPNAWVVELDDHDGLMDGALDRIREAIVAGALFIYGDTEPCDDMGRFSTCHKLDYRPYLLRDQTCPCSGVRAFPHCLYTAVGGYRWFGDFKVNQNEFPGGDYGVFLRMELMTQGTGFVRVPHALCRVMLANGSITSTFGAQQANMAAALRVAAQNGTLN